jgi:uncharacterized protein involved in tolerance to divalent cations
MSNGYTELVLSCKSWQDAQRMADILLEKHLVDSVEMLEVKSESGWRNGGQLVDKVELIVKTPPEHLNRVEQLISALQMPDSTKILLTSLI